LILNIKIFLGIRCAAHTLQLAVHDAQKKILTNLISKVRNLVKNLRNIYVSNK